MQDARPAGRGVGVVTLGEVMGLFLAEAGEPLPTARRFLLDFAGAEATVAVGLARLGHQVAYVGRLGDDAVGGRVRRALRGEGVDVGWLRPVPGGRTGLLVRDAPLGRPVSVEYHRIGSAATTLAPADLPEERIRSAALLHVTGITAVLSESSRRTVERAVDVAREAGVPISFDPNVRLKLASPEEWREVAAWFAPRADIVLVGAEDARVVTEGDASAWFLDRGARLVVVKDGLRGAWESDGGTTVHQSAVPTTCVDPVGAGDAFAAGWLDGWLNGAPAERRMLAGATVAALCVGVPGDAPGLPDASTLERVIARETDVDR